MYNPARTIEEAIRLCAPDEPLPAGDPRWQDFSPVRGLELERRIIRQIEAVAGSDHVHIVLAGHRGSGKSTELYRVKQRAEEAGYLVIYSRVNEELDPFDVDYSDILLLVSRLLEAYFRERGTPLSQRTLDYVARWFQDVTKISQEEVNFSLGVRGEAQVGAEIPFFAKLMLALTSAIQAGSTRKTEIRETVQRYPKALVDNVNLLLDEVYKVALKEKRGLLLIFDNLDRYTSEVADRFLLKNADNLKSLHCHIIYTVPISLIYRPIGDSIRDRFAPEILPMIKVREKDDSLNEEGIRLMLKALHKRMVLEEIFAEEGLARELILLSGGCLRDLMHLVRQALLEAENKVDRLAMERGVWIVRSEFSRLIQSDHYPLLARVHLRKGIEGDETHCHLLFHRFALEYDGERWADVHPLIEGLREFQDALAEERRRSGLVG